MEQKKPGMFSLDWFKEKIEKVKNSIIVKDGKIPDFHFLFIKLINDNLTVVLKNGEVLLKINATKQDYTYVCQMKYLDDVVAFMYPKELSNTNTINTMSKEVLFENFEILKTLSDFVVEEGSILYLKEVHRSLPPLLVNKFIEIINEERKNLKYLHHLQTALHKNDKYIAHKNFFLWCCLNPRVEVANNLYKFIEDNSFNITKQGFIVALRNVITLSTDTKIVEAISNSYHKIKAVWKKKPESYYLFENVKTKAFSISLKLEIPAGLRMLGNLKDLYLNLPNIAENRYTDDYTKTFDIRIGKVVNMPMEECNWNTKDCSGHAGLHFTSKEINYVGCGDTSILILINPMKIVGIGQTKGRCYEYFPIMNVSRSESTEILKDLKFDTLMLEEDYAITELAKLSKDKVITSFVSEISKHNYIVPAMYSSEIEDIIKSLNNMRDEIKDRIVKIK